MLTSDEFLSAADIANLTGKKQARQQCAVLDQRGIPYLLGAQDRPQVSRFHVRQIALGVEVRQSVGVDFSKVR